MEPYKNHLGIKNWAEEDRPREKMLLKGRAALSDAELLAILIGSGTRELSAVDVCKNILFQNNNDLNQLAKLSIKDLMKQKGIGEAKAISIVAALELGRRRKDTDKVEQVKIQSSATVYDLMKPHLLDLNNEEFWILLLNRGNMVMKKHQVSFGGVSGTVVDPKIIFKIALENLASGIILVHNHPSGQLRPSEADLRITKQLKAAGDVLEIKVLDHIIFTNESYLSFADEGLM
jgi:DNA repair protein RadC